VAPLRLNSAIAVAAAIVIGALLVPGHSSAWTKTKPVASKTRQLTGFSADVGENGYAVMAYVVPGESLPGSFEGAVFVKVKRPGHQNFQPAILRGTTHSKFTNVEIGPGGMTLLTYRGENGAWRVATKWPWGDWLPTQELPDATAISGIQATIGRDGDAALLGIDEDDEGGRTVKISTRNPVTGIFGNWVAASTDPSAVGRFAAAASDSFGHWIVAWSSNCSEEDATGQVTWVPVAGESVGEPRPLPGAECVTRGLDVQSDRAGNQFMRLGLAHGIQFSSRRHGGTFSEATTVSGRADRTDGGHLSVSGNGAATLVWGRIRDGKTTRDAYLYVKAKPGTGPGSPRRLSGARLNLKSRNDVLREVAPLPGGSLAMVFTRSWFTKQDLVKMKVGAAVWKPDSRMKSPVYTRSGPAGRFVNRIGIETSFRGAVFTWWSTQTELTARPLGYWWRARF